jgi:hypothetical protein
MVVKVCLLLVVHIIKKDDKYNRYNALSFIVILYNK